MPLYRIDDNRPQRSTYGTTLGVLVMKSRVPCIPGSVSNASSYGYPVVYRVIEQLSVQRLVYDADPTLIEPILDAALELQEAGVSAISADCGFMALFQREVAAKLHVPVALSSLLQAPLIHTLMAPGRQLGIVVADSRSVRPKMLEGVGITSATNVVIVGMEGNPAFDNAIMVENGELDSDAIERELLGVVARLVRTHPNVGAILLECSELPPYAAAVQAATGLAVFDYMTMLNWLFSSLTQRPYRGTMF